MSEREIALVCRALSFLEDESIVPPEERIILEVLARRLEALVTS